MPKKRRYRKKGTPEGVTPDIRTRHCAFFLTEQDAQWLNNFASLAGFKNRGQLVTAVIERLIVGGFSGVAFFKTHWQLLHYAEKHGSPEAYQGGFYFGTRPLPAMPDQHISQQELKKQLTALGQEVLKLNPANA